MDPSNTNQKEDQEAKWYKIPLRDWAIIFTLATVIFNIHSSNNSLVKEISEIKDVLKDQAKEFKIDSKYLNDKLNQSLTEIEILKQRVQVLERK